MAFTGSVADLQPTLKKKTAVSRSWILLDRNGSGTVLDVDKYAIMRLVEINARDLRILDPLLSYPSTILGREKVIVLNLEVNALFFLYHELLLSLVLFASGLVQSLIGLSRLVSSSSYSISKLLSPQRRCYSETRWMMMLFLLSSNFKEGCPKCLAHGQAKEKEKRRVPKKLKATKKMVRPAETSIRKEFPFEFRALEVALEAICSFLDARTRELETAAYPALDELTSKISSRNLDRVRKLKSAMTTLTNRVQKIRDELENLLDDDDDMADLYLSRKMAGSCSPTSSCDAPNWILSSPTIGSRVRRSSRASATTFQGENDVEELEMLLEAYFMQIDGTLNKLTTLREYIDDTEDYINIQLDNHRNQLIQLELFLSSGTVCLSIYSLVGAIFGMNIPYTWRQGHGYMFKWVVIFTGIFCGSLFLSIVSYARRKGLVGS